jgi:hypothetical protein
LKVTTCLEIQEAIENVLPNLEIAYNILSLLHLSLAIWSEDFL